MGIRPQNLPETHRFVLLSEGRCHYRVHGPEYGPALLLIHGATVPGWEFDRLAPFLNRTGYRTFIPDLYGHGYSDRPRKPHSHELFVNQMSQFLDTLHIGSLAGVLGHSLGAAIAARLAFRSTVPIQSLLLAAPLVDFEKDQLSTRLLKLPMLGEILTAGFVVPMLVRRRRRNYRTIEDGRFAEMFVDQLRKPGFGRSLLSMFRAGSLGNQEDCYKELGQACPPTLIMSGTDDQIVTVEQLRRVQALLPSAGRIQVHGAGHAFMLTHPEHVWPEIVDFLSRSQPKVSTAIA